MNTSYCQKEQEVLEALERGRWPDVCDEALRAHVASCAVCTDVALVADFLRQEDIRARTEAVLPDAVAVWWKAQLLAKRAAAERAAQPLALAERFACACATLALFGMAIWQRRLILNWVDRLSNFWTWNGASLRDFYLGLWNQQPSFLILTASTLLLFVAFFAYLVWAEE
jgi:hypothetical protein